MSDVSVDREQEKELTGDWHLRRGKSLKNEERSIRLEYGRLCRDVPDCDSAVTRFFGPTTQHTRQPGSLQFLVRPSIITTESYIERTQRKHHKIEWYVEGWKELQKRT